MWTVMFIPGQWHSLLAQAWIFKKYENLYSGSCHLVTPSSMAGYFHDYEKRPCEFAWMRMVSHIKRLSMLHYKRPHVTLFLSMLHYKRPHVTLFLGMLHYKRPHVTLFLGMLHYKRPHVTSFLSMLHDKRPHVTVVLSASFGCTLPILCQLMHLDFFYNFSYYITYIIL